MANTSHEDLINLGGHYAYDIQKNEKNKYCSYDLRAFNISTTKPNSSAKLSQL